MLTCIACSKQLNNGRGSYQEHDDNDGVGTPTAKHSVKSLTAHIKEMALKASGAYKNCKPCAGPSRSNYAESEATSASGRFYGTYRRAESCNSTPRRWGNDMVESRMKGVLSGEGTPLSISGRVEAIVFMEEDEPKEWVAQVEPGVLITFVSLPRGGNNLKKIQFSREMFNKWEAQKWWGQNYERVMELYNVQRSIQQAEPSQEPPRSEDERSKVESAESCPATPPLNETQLPRSAHHPSTKVSSDSLDRRPVSHELTGQVADSSVFSSINAARTEANSASASARTSSSHEPNYSGELSVSNASDTENDWVEQDEPGVYITLRALPGGIRELRRVRFSRERFGEMHARLWWEENRARIQEQYLR